MQVFIPYDEYLKSDWWHKLKEKHIYSNPGAKCFLCQKSYTLLLHHVRYDTLYHERLGKDIYILCFKCHERAHFYRILWIFKKKVSLTKSDLTKRIMQLKSINLIRNRQFILSIAYLFRYIFSF